MFAVLSVFLVIAVLVAATGHRLGRRVLLVAAAAPAVALGWALAGAADIGAGVPVTETRPWVPALGLELSFRLDGLAWMFVVVVAGIGVAVFVHARWYLEPGSHSGGSDPAGSDLAFGRLAALLVGFAGAMIGLVLSDNLLVMFVFWELTSVTSFLLIGIEDRRGPARAAALQALLVTGAGSLVLLGGLVLMGQQAGTFTLSAILAAPPAGGMVDVALGLVLVGALAKSAQVPFSFWLPAAMAAPTPVSAYLHSATMVTAGVYIVARLSPAFGGSGPWRALVLSLGAASLVFGAYRAMRQHDLKALLAYSTVSQLGLMMVLFGVATPAAVLAGCALLVAHALFKACLFLVVGTVDHQVGTRDLRRLGGLATRWPGLAVAATLAAASMAGLPPLMGFLAKEAGLTALLDAPLSAGVAAGLLAAVVVGSAGTLAYSFRLVWGAFGPGEAHVGSWPADAVVDPAAGPRPGVMLVAVPLVLAGAGLVLGLVPGMAGALIEPAAAALAPPGEVTFGYGHGFTSALALSGLVIVLGGALVLARRRLERFQANVAHPVSGSAVYQRVLKGVLTVADQVAGTTQRGSLPFYLTVILFVGAVASVVPLGWGVARGQMPAVVGADGPGQALVVVVLLVAAVSVALAQRRVVAVVLTGVVGYATAALFVIQGAPDLALTQVLVETLGVLAFLFVLGRLPARFPALGLPGTVRSGRPLAGGSRRRSRSAVGSVARLALAATVGITVAGGLLLATGSRTDAPVSRDYLERAVPDGGGHNVVNVIVVDFRGLDTLGEITVLAVAALGVTAVGPARRRIRRSPMSPDQRSILLVWCVRAEFHTVMAVSLYLLFTGHDRPGGGFPAGLVAGAALVARYLAEGPGGIDRAVRLRPVTILGAGLALSVATAVAPLLVGASGLEAVVASVEVPALGSVRVASPLIFDTGVYLVVVGLVLVVITVLGAAGSDLVPSASDPVPGESDPSAPALEVGR